MIVFPNLSSGRELGARNCLASLLTQDLTRSLMLSAWGRLLYREMQDLGCSYQGVCETVTRGVCLGRGPDFRRGGIWDDPCEDWLDKYEREARLVISNGWYTSRINARLLSRLLDQYGQTDVVVLKVTEDLVGYREKILTRVDQAVVGFRRYYEDSVELRPIGDEWPHHIIARREALQRIFGSGQTIRDVREFAASCEAHDISIVSANIAGVSCPLTTRAGLHRVLTEEILEQHAGQGRDVQRSYRKAFVIENPILVDREAFVDDSAIIIGPTVITKGASVGAKAIVDHSVLLPEAVVAANEFVADSVIGEGRLQEPEPPWGPGEGVDVDIWSHALIPDRDRFSNWPRWSYSRAVKRIFDVLMALFVLALFLPVIPIIALAIKLDSKGPVFYRARRQGRYGREFDCLKFRTMRIGAEVLQEGLRKTNEVDGPQFKMADDPRISRVGHFLRETYIDEIPQFFNVLCGQMSVVGPRPSPPSENTLCPWWRDARLSVRPGVTGLWQIKRTREPGKDFQEWILFDTDFVKRIGFKMDVWICWQTVVSMAGRFVQFF